MPEGVVEDSRSSNSPQWGYLKVVRDSGACTGNPKEDDELFEQMNLYDGDLLGWDRTLVFVNETTNTNGPLQPGDRVCFRPKSQRAEDPENNVDVNYVVAIVTSRVV